MTRRIILYVRITEEQEKELATRTRKAGFNQKADYVRSILFINLSTEEKINRIYAKVCENG
jgi:hypothetical protein